jgi:hypothetical protein
VSEEIVDLLGEVDVIMLHSALGMWAWELVNRSYEERRDYHRLPRLSPMSPGLLVNFCADSPTVRVAAPGNKSTSIARQGQHARLRNVDRAGVVRVEQPDARCQKRRKTFIGKTQDLVSATSH